MLSRIPETEPELAKLHARTDTPGACHLRPGPMQERLLRRRTHSRCAERRMILSGSSHGLVGTAVRSLSIAQLAATIAALAADKKAADIVELDVRGVIGYTDFFPVCPGNTARQMKGIHDGIHESLKDDRGLLPRRVEGVREARWLLMDYLDVVMLVITPEARDFYRLEQLWGEVRARALEPVQS